MKKVAVWLSLLLALACPALATDTLEVFVLRVQFQEESPDNSLTTGTGLFDSGETSENYSLDPAGRRGTIAYWRKHCQFANDYFMAASGGKQAVTCRIFPEDGTTAYQLDKYIIDYNRTTKKKDEKTAEYDEARSQDYMTFVFDALKKAYEASDSPLKIALPESEGTTRAYMILHAGASRLVDGGSLGTDNSDTPGDFMDVFVTADYWAYLPPDSVGLSSGDSVMGLVFEGAAMDTIKEVMVVSETASQDGLNWGINGILVNQIGRMLGMPNTYDVVQGISRLGYFDVMDFAGYSAGNGFLPVLPSAWLRSYMGWTTVKTVSAKAGKSVTVELSAAGSGTGTEILKVPLSSNEYLMIENRERVTSDNGYIDIYLSTDQDDSVVTTRSVPIDSLSLVFDDSVCTTKSCKVNTRKASGIIVGASSYDATVPASGIAVWKVNEWYLRESLPYGVTNYWGGDTLRDHQYGLALVEADGILTLGKEFTNSLGEDTYDYGSGTDLLPHFRFSTDTAYDTVYSILPTGYGNTATVQGGYTGVKVTAKLPSSFRKEVTSNSFFGDSVVNFASPTIKVTVSFGDISLEGGDFPKQVGLETPPRAVVLADYPSGMTAFEGEKLLVFGSTDGTLQALSAFGEAVIDPDTTITTTVISNSDSITTVPLYRLGASHDSLRGLASSGSTIFSLHRKAFVRTELSASLDQIAYEVDSVKLDSGIAGPIILDTLAWILADGTLKAYPLSGKWKQVAEAELPTNFVPQDFALCKDDYGERFVVSGKNATLAVASEGSSPSYVQLPTSDKGLVSVKNQSFKVACSDFNRDGVVDAFVIGSRGYGAVVSLGSDSLKVIETPRQYRRGGAGDGLSYQEKSPPAVADVNDDGYPEAVFLGHNKVYAVDYKGIAISGFPVTFSRGTPEYEFGSDPLLVDITGDKVPEILAPAPGGLLYAYTGKGKAVGGSFPLSAGSFEYEETSTPLSVFVGDAADTVAGLELYAFHRDYVSAFSLASASEAGTNWALPGNGNSRTGFFDASVLSDVDTSGSKEEITEFFIYPNPVRGGTAKTRFTIGADAEYAQIEIFDITGLCVFKQKVEGPTSGTNQWDYVDLSKLGSDVYTVRLKVKFESGKSKQKFYRIGVIR